MSTALEVILVTTCLFLLFLIAPAQIRNWAEAEDKQQQTWAQESHTDPVLSAKK